MRVIAWMIASVFAVNGFSEVSAPSEGNTHLVDSFTVADYTGNALEMPLVERLTFTGSWFCGVPFTMGVLRYHAAQTGKSFADLTTSYPFRQSEVQDQGLLEMAPTKASVSGPAVYQLRYQRGTKPKWYNHIHCVAQVRANLLIGDDKFLATQEVFSGDNVDQLMKNVSEGLENLGAFYVPAKSVGSAELPHINTATAYAFGYGCSENGRLNPEFKAGTKLASKTLTANLSVIPVLVEGKLHFPGIFWIGQGGTKHLPCLNPNNGTAAKKDFFVTLYSGEVVGGGLYPAVGDLYSAFAAQSEPRSGQNP